MKLGAPQVVSCNHVAGWVLVEISVHRNGHPTRWFNGTGATFAKAVEEAEALIAAYILSEQPLTREDFIVDEWT